MRKLIITVCALLGAFALFAASPAATQKWVQDYLATHGGASIAWVIDYVRTNVATTAATAAQDERTALQTRMQNALAMALLDASNSGLYALSFSYATPSNGLLNVNMAERDGGGWTNVVYGCGVSTNAQYEAVLVMDALDYECAYLDKRL